MGTKGREIIGLDVGWLVETLNSALSDEWFAYYQYWLGAKVVKGPMKDAVAAELLQHAAEELSHAELLADRIIQLGGTPVLSPRDWYDMGHCGYLPPADPVVTKILDQNIQGEQCAISVYQPLLEKTKDKDPVTYNIILTILTQEVEHEEDLQALKEDLQLLKESLKDLMEV